MSDTTCDPCDDTQWIIDRIAAKKALVVSYEAAIGALATGAQSYQLNTGQTQQLVTRANLGSMRLMVKGLEGDISTLQARLGCARFNVVPGW
jgi:hypothetical protein